MARTGDDVRIGIIGLGYWGPNLVRNFASIEGAQLVSVCDADPTRISKVLKEHPGISGTPDAGELISDDSLDALVIVSSAATHYELAGRAMSAGKHVFVEKPLALTAAEGEDLVRVSREKERVLMVGHLLLYHPVVQWIKEYADSGELGDIMYMYSQRLNLGRVRHDENCLWSIGPHDVSVMLYLVGAGPTEVSVHGMDYVQEGIEDVIFCNLKFPDDVIGNLHISWLDPHKERRMTIVGKKKMLVFDDMAPSEKLRIYDKGVDVPDEYLSFAESLTLRSGDVVSPAIAMSEPLRLECLHFIECVRSGTEPLSGGGEGLAVLRVLEAGQKSLEAGGAPITI